jgi:hypothetical protein
MRARRTSITTRQAPATISIDSQHTLRCRYVALRDYKPAFKGAFLAAILASGCPLGERRVNHVAVIAIMLYNVLHINDLSLVTRGVAVLQPSGIRIIHMDYCLGGIIDHSTRVLESM